VVLQRRGSRWVGVGIGVATAIKLIPGIFIIYLVMTRRWRAVGVSVGAFAAATLLGVIAAPHDSWVYFTQKIVTAEGVGQFAYTFNQSLFGLLARQSLPDQPDSLVWLLLVLPVLGYGLWRAARAGSAGDEYTAMAITGFTGSLISPLTWAHHI